MLGTATALILLSGMLGACSMQQPPRTVSDLCLIDAPLKYTLVPKSEREAAAAEGREVRDDGNKADSDALRDQIGEHNARWRAVCEPAR
jgi:hypothetical protein